MEIGRYPLASSQPRIDLKRAETKLEIQDTQQLSMLHCNYVAAHIVRAAREPLA
jgi:hypothetical protein